MLDRNEVLSRESIDCILLSSVDDHYQSAYVDCETSFGPVLRVTDEECDGRMVLEVLEPNSEQVLARIDLKDALHILKSAADMLVLK